MRKPKSPKKRPLPSKPTAVRTSNSRDSNTQKTPSKGNNTSKSNATARTSMDVSRRTRRSKAGTAALRQIRSLQRTTHLLIPKLSFSRVVREIISQLSYHDMRIQSSALQALQEAAEMYMVQFFEDSLLCTLHAKRVTLLPRDCHLMRRLRGPAEVANR